MSISINNIKLRFFNENSINLLLNHLAVVYAFFLPIGYAGYARSFIFSLMLILILFRKKYFYYFSKSFKNPIAIAFFLYTAMYYIWLIGTEDIKYAHWTLHYMKLGFYPLIFYTFLDNRFTTRIISAMIFGVMISEVVSYLMFFEIIPWEFKLENISLPWKSGLTTIGFYKPIHFHDPAPFLSHEIYGPLLALSVTILSYNLINKNTSLIIKFASSIFILTMTSNIFIVGGRMGQLLFFIMILSLYFVHSKKASLKTFLMTCLFLISVFTIAYSSNGIFKKRFDETVSTITNTFNGPINFHTSMGERLGLWYYSIDKIKENLFLGHGTGDQMITVRSNIPDKDAHLKIMPTMHNHYFDIILQFGLFGLFIYFYLIYQIIKFDTKNKAYNHIKLYIIFVIFMISFTSILFLFFMALLSFIIPVLTANKDILKNNIEPIDIKLFTKYFIFSLFSYTYEQLQ